MEPLAMEHHSDLCAAGLHETLWRLIPTPLKTPDDMADYIHFALEGRDKGDMLPFATVDSATGKAIGCTRFCAIDAANKRTEIGWTWITPESQRTFVNTEAKYLMLKHAFESWNCNRVELKTDNLNEQSKNAMLRLGAKPEGVFRHHMIVQDGRLRDSAYFSIIKPEWPDVKANLEAKMKGYE
jgi:RimJ/RimL family protein N-acetyltransferase